jgi:hypothetical protein
MGFIGIARDFSGNGEFFRFTGVMVPEGTFTTWKKSETTH